MDVDVDADVDAGTLKQTSHGKSPGTSCREKGDRGTHPSHPIPCPSLFT